MCAWFPVFSLACFWTLMPASLHPWEENSAMERARLWSPSDLVVRTGDNRLAKTGWWLGPFLPKTCDNSSSVV